GLGHLIDAVILAGNELAADRADATRLAHHHASLGDPLRAVGAVLDKGMRSRSSRDAPEVNSSGGSHGRSRWQSAEMRRYCMAPSGSDVRGSVKPKLATGTRFFAVAPRSNRIEGLFREPDVVEPPTVVDAVDHRRQPLDPRVPAG